MLVVAPARSQPNAFWSILDLTQPLLTLFQLVIDPCTQALHEVHGSGAYHVWLSHPLLLRLSDFGEPCHVQGIVMQLRLLLALVSGPRVAVVVTVNCFLAKFCSAFGKYLTLGVQVLFQFRQFSQPSFQHLGSATEWRRMGLFSASCT